MAYPADLVGKAIQMRIPKNPLTAVNPNLILTGHAPDLTVGVFSYTPGRPGAGGAPPVPPRFVNLNAPWNISFLEYHPGEVTTVRLQRPVLTGPMSGCYLFSYVVGGPRIAHVGTHDLGPDAPFSVRAKTNWKAYIAQQGATSIVGATPADFYSPGERATSQIGKMGGVPQVYGLFEVGGNSYAVLLAPIGSDVTVMPNMWKFVALKQMTLQPWSSIAALRTFR
jgi:hypothetical protein